MSKRKRTVIALIVVELLLAAVGCFAWYLYRKDMRPK